MLFKALSAAVFGIDAYLVGVEVDVGSGRMGDFNVVGLPDIAGQGKPPRAHQGRAQELRLRFLLAHPKPSPSTSRPPTSAKKAPGLDLPMALGILGCQGALFLAKPLSGYAFLG